MANFVLTGPEDTSGIPDVPIGKLFMDAFKTFEKNTIAAINIDSGESLTYEQLYQLSNNLAASLRLLGITKNDNIALVAENSQEFLIVYLAAFFLAAPLHLVNPKDTKYELKHILSLSTPVVVFCTKKSQANVTQVVHELSFVKILMCLDVVKLNYDRTSFQIEENIDTSEHVALICNSSGTTGLPKGVMETHKALRLHCVHGRDPAYFDIKRGQFIPLVLPFFHIYAVHVINAALYAGATIIPFERFDPGIFLETIQKYKPEKLILVPTLINFLGTSPLADKYDISSVTQVYTAGSPLSPEDSKIVWQRLNLQKLHVIYGMTEVGLPTHTSDNSNGSVGRVQCGHTIKIINVQTGRALPPLENGEICIGGTIMKGYINNIEKTKEVIDSDGFLHSGDVGYYDKNGFVFVIGRIKDIIKYKSFQVSPTELENILLKHEGIKDVAVVGRPDRRCGELPTGFVVMKDGSRVTKQEINDYLAEFVSEEKWLHGGVEFVDAIPRNSMGKILRRKLVENIDDICF